MLRIKWLNGNAKNYTDVFPDSVLSLPETIACVHCMMGPQGGMYLAKCDVSLTDDNIDFNYRPYPKFNNRYDVESGLMRVTIKNGSPSDVFWTDDEQEDFERVETKICYEPGRSTAEFDIKYIRGANQTETDQLKKARLGQGSFRKGLQIRWQGKCALTKIGNDAVLRASHIKPWAVCNNTERLSPDNGLLLAAHVDALFDRYLITFGEQGELIWHSSVSEPDKTALALPSKLCQELRDAEMLYLKEHRRLTLV